METITSPNLFVLGQIVLTRGVHDALAGLRQPGQTNIDYSLIAGLIRRHVSGDWGDLCPEDVEENKQSVKLGFRILSVYKDTPIGKVWVITEADRSATTVLFPSEY